MTQLFEGLKANDLEDLVRPLVSIDEYESKLDDDSIVVAFYVQDHDPANDLNRFIQKGATAILDTDVSPAPNEDGYFMVFVEFMRDQEFPQKLLDSLESLEGLTCIDEWKVQIYGEDEMLDLSKELLETKVRLIPNPEDVAPNDVTTEEIKEFFRSSDLDDLIVEGRTVSFEARGVTWTLQYVDHGHVDDVCENNAVMAQANRLDEGALSNVRRMCRMLGEQWIALQRGDHIVVSHALSGECGLFKL